MQTEDLCGNINVICTKPFFPSHLLKICFYDLVQETKNNSLVKDIKDGVEPQPKLKTCKCQHFLITTFKCHFFLYIK